ncbi:MAG: band 7 protein [Myxococcales bacterium]|nr:band 7 protein [Myxococcales bacterium]MCB9525722.1 band 7 protein [Myxococcales bacterium]
MAEIRRFPFLSHLRSESNAYVVRTRNGQAVARGRGLAFWFRPLTHSVAELPLDDREFAFVAHGRSKDFQEVTVQGAVAWRLGDPDRAAERLDFNIDLATGAPKARPLEQIETLVGGLAEQVVQRAVALHPVHALLGEALQATQQGIASAIQDHPAIVALGVEVVGVRVGDIKPSPEVEKALQTPTRERIQQSADEAKFARRAQAVDKERAIAENELSNRIELAKREADLIERRGQNVRREAVEAAEAARIESEAEAARNALAAETEAEKVRRIALARAEGERARLAIYETLEPKVILALAAQELAKKLNRIDHLNLSPEALGPMLQELLSAGTKRLGG